MTSVSKAGTTTTTPSRSYDSLLIFNHMVKKQKATIIYQDEKPLPKIPKLSDLITDLSSQPTTTLAITTKQAIPLTSQEFNDDIKREASFYEFTLQAIRSKSLSNLQLGRSQHQNRKLFKQIDDQPKIQNPLVKSQIRTKNINEKLLQEQAKNLQNIIKTKKKVEVKPTKATVSNQDKEFVIKFKNENRLTKKGTKVRNSQKIKRPGKIKRRLLKTKKASMLK